MMFMAGKTGGLQDKLATNSAESRFFFTEHARPFIIYIQRYDDVFYEHTTP